VGVDDVITERLVYLRTEAVLAYLEKAQA